MDSRTEKLYIIEQIIKLNDDDLVHAIKNLLDFGLKYQPNASSQDFWDTFSPKQKERIDNAIKALDNGEGIPHETVMKNLKKKFQQ